MMLIPLAIGLFINARYEDAAAKIQPTFGQASNIAILVLTVLGLVLNFKEMIGLVCPTRTWEDYVDLAFTVVESEARVDIECTTRTEDRTGVEMEALTAVSVACLTMPWSSHIVHSGCSARNCRRALRQRLP